MNEQEKFCDELMLELMGVVERFSKERLALFKLDMPKDLFDEWGTASMMVGLHIYKQSKKHRN